MLTVSSGKGRVAAETGTVAGIGGADTLADHIPGLQEPPLRQIGMDGRAGLLMEQPHQMIFADIKMLCQMVDHQIVAQVFLHIAQNIQNTVILRLDGGRVEQGFLLLKTSDMDQQLQQQSFAHNLTTVLILCKFLLQLGGQCGDALILQLIRPQYMTVFGVKTGR